MSMVRDHLQDRLARRASEEVEASLEMRLRAVDRLPCRGGTPRAATQR
jgi:hypothetical protein